MSDFTLPNHPTLTANEIERRRLRSERRAELVKVSRRAAALATLEADDAVTRSERARLALLVAACDQVLRHLVNGGAQ